jgi:hypothetical protein
LMNTKILRKVLGAILTGALLLGGVSSMAASPPEDIKEARKYAEEMLLPLEGIAGISHVEEPPKIIVYLEHEEHKGKVPDKIKGFDVEVKVIGRIKALGVAGLEVLPQQQSTFGAPVNRTGVVRPIVGGISCGVPEAAFDGIMAGTLGVVTHEPFILSNAHVIAMDKDARFLPIGTPVLQPGTLDGGTLGDRVGALHRYIKIIFGLEGENYADAAIATIDHEIGHLKVALLGADNLTTYTVALTPTEVDEGDWVRKSGRTTGVTENIVIDCSATVKVWYAPDKFAIFYDQILVLQPFALPGDSGSLVDRGGGFVGLVFAGTPYVVVVCKAEHIIKELGIRIAP